MAYVDQKSGPSATGLAGAFIVQAAIGAAIVTGLSVTQIIETEDKNPDAVEFPIEPPPPPEPTPVEPEPKTSEAVPEVSPPITAPETKIDFDIPRPDVRASDIILPPMPPIPKPKPTGIPSQEPLPKVTPTGFDPVSAKPRNDPGAWLSDRDYRSSWARRDLTGVAKFRLDISAQGKVSGCRIIGSTGHAELDEATCALVGKRARFEPARGTSGEPVAGNYTGSVMWQLPD